MQPHFPTVLRKITETTSLQLCPRMAFFQPILWGPGMLLHVCCIEWVSLLSVGYLCTTFHFNNLIELNRFDLMKRSVYTFIVFMFLQEMLFRRTCKLIELETVKKNTEKAKPNKRDMVCSWWERRLLGLISNCRTSVVCIW